MLQHLRSLLSVGIGATLACAGVAHAQSSVGVLDVLTYNVAGLPEGISSSNPATNTPLLAPKLAPYALVHVQEDFNYHAALYAGDNHPYRTPTSGGAAIGDGLNTLSNYPFNDFTRVKWDKCNGTDCLTPKGFSYMQVRLDNGVLLDVYNAHPNAGTETADLAARRANISQLSQFIGTWSAGNAVLVMMDSNTRYTRSEDNIRELIASNDLIDPWVELIKGTAPAAGAAPLLCGTPPTNSCEVVDKILYRAAPQLTLAANRYQLDPGNFYDSAGKPLSDHYPLYTQFGWAVGADVRTSDSFGGPHGVPFNDVAGGARRRPPAPTAQRHPARRRTPGCGGRQPGQRRHPGPRRQRRNRHQLGPAQRRDAHLGHRHAWPVQRPHPVVLAQPDHQPGPQHRRRHPDQRTLYPHRPHRLAYRRLHRPRRR